MPLGDMLQGIAAPASASPETTDFARRVLALATARDAQAAEWALRSAVHGEGQTVIAEQAGVPVDRVRQRISRLFAWVRENSSQLAWATLVLAVVGLWGLLSRHEPRPVSHPRPAEPRGTTADRAAPLRSKAESECRAQIWRECLKSLDEAREIDPAGEEVPRVQEMRQGGSAVAQRRAFVRTNRRTI